MISIKEENKKKNLKKNKKRLKFNYNNNKLKE